MIFHGPAVGACAIEVNQYVARLGALAWADDPAVFELVHYSCCAGVTEAEPALEQGHAGFFLASDDFDALLNELFILADAVGVVEAAVRTGELLVDFDLVTWLACLEMNSTIRDISGSVTSAPWARMSFAEPGGR